LDIRPLVYIIRTEKEPDMTTTTTTINTPTDTVTRIRPAGMGRATGVLLALMIAWAIGLTASITPSISFAAERGVSSVGVSTKLIPAGQRVDDPFATIGTKLETTAKNVAKIATPVAIVCIVIVLVMYLFAPLLPDIAQQNKGYIIRALVIVAMIGFIPELVKAVSAFGGSS
jgi:hypothetical protein